MLGPAGVGRDEPEAAGPERGDGAEPHARRAAGVLRGLPVRLTETHRMAPHIGHGGNGAAVVIS